MRKDEGPCHRWRATERGYLLLVLAVLGLLVHSRTLSISHEFAIQAPMVTVPKWKFPADVAPHQVVIVMCDNRWNPPTDYLALSAAINAAYANYHGHRFLACDNDKDFTPEQVPPTFPYVGKLQCILKAMTEMENVRMVVYIDSDAMLQNFTQTFTQFIQTNVVPPSTPVPPSMGPTVASLSPEDIYDVIVPTDCDKYRFNTGLQIWKNTPSAQQFLQLWIKYTLSYKRFKRFDYEQKSFRQLFEARNSPTGYIVATIPRGTGTWHMGNCHPKGSPFSDPANFLPHITGRWANARVPFMQNHIRELCVHKESPWAIPDLADCEHLVKLLDKD